MKLLIALYIISISILSYNKIPIVMKIESKIKMSKYFENGIKEVFIENNFSFVDINKEKKSIKKENLKKQHSSDVNDDKHLVKPKKTQAAKLLLFININKLGKLYSITAKIINLKNARLEKVKTLIYKDKLSDKKRIFNFAKKLASGLLNVPNKNNNKLDNKRKVKKSKKK